MKKICFVILVYLFFIGCGPGNSRGSDDKGKTTRALINRSFEDLTLGMSIEEFKSKLIYEELSVREGELDRSYTVYSAFYNSLYRPYSQSKPPMKEIENVYDVYCSFVEDKLFKIHISYFNSYQPTWDNFIHNAKEKYGEDIKAGSFIRWDDGKTTLTISEFYGNQYLNARDSYYGNHYIVTYEDKELGLLIDKKEKKQAPEF